MNKADEMVVAPPSLYISPQKRMHYAACLGMG